MSPLAPPRRRPPGGAAHLSLLTVTVPIMGTGRRHQPGGRGKMNRWSVGVLWDSVVLSSASS